MFRIGSVVMALLALLAGDSTSNAQALLRWKFKPGQVIHLTMTQKTKQTVTSGETPPIPMDMTNIMDMKWKVEAVDSQGVASVAQTFDRMRISMQGAPGMSFEFDSASGKDPEGAAKMIASIMKPMVGAAMIVKMTARGDVVEVKLPEAMESLKKMAAAGGMGDMLSPEGIKKMSGLGVLPEKPVKPGDSWSNTAEMKSPFLGTIAMEQKYTYLGPVERGGRTLERIGIATRTKPPVKKDPGPASAMEMEGTAESYFDNRIGRLVENAGSMKMKMNMNMMGQKIAMTGETSASIKASDAEAKPAPK
jgi:hypothetical protein